MVSKTKLIDYNIFEETDNDFTEPNSIWCRSVLIAKESEDDKESRLNPMVPSLLSLKQRAVHDKVWDYTEVMTKWLR